MSKALAIALALAFALLSTPARAVLPSGVARAFLDTGIPLSSISVVVREAGAARPLFAVDADRAMNPASVMKLITTYAALDLLGRDYRWRTEAYLGGPLEGGRLSGDLILKGYGDPKITIERWKAFMAELRARGLEQIDGDLVLDRTYFRTGAHDPAAFDHEPLRPYNVGPDALLVNFNAVRFVFAPDAKRGAVSVRTEPPLPEVVLEGMPALATGECGDWRSMLGAAFTNHAASASAAFTGRYAETCAERDWNLALLDHPHYVAGMFSTYFREAGGDFSGKLKEGLAPRTTAPFAVLMSPPLHEIVRDINKLSNNVMARQLFLTLASTAHPPPATTGLAADVVQRWLNDKRIRMPGLVLENGSGLSRNERATAGGLAQLLATAYAGPFREDFVDSLAVAAVDGTVERRFRNTAAAGQALLKTGSLEGVRAMAGYVINPAGRRFIVVAIINHPNAAKGGAGLDYLVQWVYHQAGRYNPQLRR